MQLTRKQTLAFRNAIAKELNPAHDKNDPQAWSKADLKTLKKIERIIGAVKLIPDESHESIPVIKNSETKRKEIQRKAKIKK